MKILEKLSARKHERAKANAASWAQFVADIVDERTKDADEILSGLDRLQKSPEELQAACELLIERREWNSQATAGDAAEIEYSKLQQHSDDAEKALKDLIEKHHAKHEPLDRKIQAARTAISTGADAKRRLRETAGEESRRTAFADIDAELQKLQAEHQPVLKAIHDRQTWIREIESRGQSAATADRQRLPDAKTGLAVVRKQDTEFTGKLSALQDRRSAANELLLRPECI